MYKMGAPTIWKQESTTLNLSWFPSGQMKTIPRSCRKDNNETNPNTSTPQKLESHRVIDDISRSPKVKLFDRARSSKSNNFLGIVDMPSRATPEKEYKGSMGRYDVHSPGIAWDNLGMRSPADKLLRPPLSPWSSNSKKKSNSAIPIIYGSHVTMESPDPMSKFHCSNGSIQSLFQRSATRKTFLSEKSPRKSGEIPMISGSNVTMASPDPLSKFHEGPGPTYAEAFSPMHIYDFSSIQGDKENIHVNLMPLIEENNVMTTSPARHVYTISTAITAARSIHELSPIVESPDPLSKFNGRGSYSGTSKDVPDISSLSISPDTKPISQEMNFRRKVCDSRRVFEQDLKDDEKITENSQSEREKNIQQSFFSDVNPKSRIRAIQDLRKSSELTPIILEPKPPSVPAPEKNKIQRPAGPRRVVVCVPKSKEMNINSASPSDSVGFTQHSPDSVSASLSPVGFYPENKISDAPPSTVIPENLLNAMKQEELLVTESDESKSSISRKPHRRRRDQNYNWEGEDDEIDGSSSIKLDQNKPVTLMLPKKLDRERCYKRGGKMYVFRFELDPLPEYREMNHGFPLKFQSALGDIRHAIGLSKRHKKKKDQESILETRDGEDAVISDDEQYSRQQDYVARYCKRFNRKNKTILYLFSEKHRKKNVNSAVSTITREE